MNPKKRSIDNDTLFRLGMLNTRFIKNKWIGGENFDAIPIENYTLIYKTLSQ